MEVPPNLNATAEPIKSNENKMSCRGQSPAASFAQKRNAAAPKAFGAAQRKNFWGAHASSVVVGKPGRSFTRVTAASCRNELLLTGLSTVGQSPIPVAEILSNLPSSARKPCAAPHFMDLKIGNNFRLDWPSDDFDVCICDNQR